jgi:type IV secretory pathway VirB10-like protein
VSDAPDRSPALLRAAPRRGAGVRRLNRLPIVFVTGGAMLVVAAIGYTYRDRLMQATANAQAAASHKPAPSSDAAVLGDAPAGGEVVPAAARTSIPAKPLRTASRTAQLSRSVPSDGSGEDSGQAQGKNGATKARQEAWRTYYAQVAKLQKARLSAATTAMTADTGLSNHTGGQAAGPNTAGSGATGSPSAIPYGSGPGLGAGTPGVTAGLYPGGFGVPAYPPARVDTNAQSEKQAFLNQPGDVTGSSDGLQARLRNPSSPFLVMAGTAIPAVMVGGINSDMPGMVVGQVSRNVYDTATGRYLLIPQGARLIGTYDNMVSSGQTRVAVIWNRIIFPDAESIDLGSMEGADQGGYAGFHDRVDTHFWSKIGNALLISIAGAGVQLSQGTGQTTNGYNSQQIAAAALGQQFGELGEEYARAGLAIPNTLKIRPGYRFVVMVNKDMHLRPYVDHRTMAGVTPVSLGPVLR